MNRYGLAGCLLVAGALTAAVPRNQPNGIKFEVISVKVMSNEESTKIAGPDFIGADVLVRLRLSASRGDISFYALKYNKKPIGHRTEWSSAGEMWVHPIGAKKAKEVSPGIGGLGRVGLPTAWFPLDAGTTVECEVLDGTSNTGEKHGTSAFVRFLPDETPVEIFSEPYLVPAAAPTKP
jgi:hypothetical protein